MPVVTKSEYTFTSSDGVTPIHVAEWIPDGKIAGVVQLAHGIAEYIDRYENFAEFLASNGFAVVGNGHLGHGKSIASDENLGFFSRRDGWNKVVDDMETLRRLTAEKLPDTPYFLFGHSMGSFLARTYLIRFPDAPLKGVILSGTGHTPAIMTAGGRLLCAVEAARHGPLYQSRRVHDAAFGTYNKSFEPHRTDFDWLSGNTEVVDAYVADPLCGFTPSVSLFRDMMGGLDFISKKSNLKKMNPDLPVLLISGRRDPVGKNGKGVMKVYTMFRSAGMRNILCRLYQDGRHEMLNEPNRDAVHADILSWLSGIPN